MSFRKVQQFNWILTVLVLIFVLCSACAVLPAASSGTVSSEVPVSSAEPVCSEVPVSSPEPVSSEVPVSSAKPDEIDKSNDIDFVFHNKDYTKNFVHQNYLKNQMFCHTVFDIVYFNNGEVVAKDKYGNQYEFTYDPNKSEQTVMIKGYPCETTITKDYVRILSDFIDIYISLNDLRDLVIVEYYYYKLTDETITFYSDYLLEEPLVCELKENGEVFYAGGVEYRFKKSNS